MVLVAGPTTREPRPPGNPTGGKRSSPAQSPEPEAHGRFADPRPRYYHVPSGLYCRVPPGLEPIGAPTFQGTKEPPHASVTDHGFPGTQVGDRRRPHYSPPAPLQHQPRIAGGLETVLSYPKQPAQFVEPRRSDQADGNVQVRAQPSQGPHELAQPFLQGNSWYGNNGQMANLVPKEYQPQRLGRGRYRQNTPERYPTRQFPPGRHHKFDWYDQGGQVNPGQQASPQRTAGVSDQQLAFMAMSNHLLESGLITTSIDKFNGDSPSEFWGWINRLKEYAIRLNLSPERTLQLWESYAEGPVLTMIRRHRRSRGPVTHQAVNELFDRLVLRYGDVNRIVTDLESMINELDPIKDVTDVKQLWNLMDICHLTLANQKEGNGHKLSKLNDSEGIKYIRGKLPYEIQTAWSHFGAAYERRFG